MILIIFLAPTTESSPPALSDTPIAGILLAKKRKKKKNRIYFSIHPFRSNSDEFESNMNLETGVFVAPEEGEYEVSFSGLLKSYGGRRVWATLYKLDKDDEGGKKDSSYGTPCIYIFFAF